MAIAGGTTSSMMSQASSGLISNSSSAMQAAAAAAEVLLLGVVGFSEAAGDGVGGNGIDAIASSSAVAATFSDLIFVTFASDEAPPSMVLLISARVAGAVDFSHLAFEWAAVDDDLSDRSENGLVLGLSVLSTLLE